jgi:Bacterial SH3 domain
MGDAVNRGNRKIFVTVTLIVLSVVAALIVEVIGGSSGGASTPNSSGTKTNSPALARPPNGTTGTVASASYRTVGTDVNLRSGPNTGSSVITTMSDLGSPVTLTCYVAGTSIAGDLWWYRASFISARGYVSGFWVNTGPDPAKTRLPAC